MDNIDKERLDYCKEQINDYLKEHGLTTCPADVWRRFLDSQSGKAWINKAHESNKKNFPAIISRLAYMLLGIVAVDSAKVELMKPAVYEKKLSRLRYREVFSFVQKFARGGEVITGEEYMSGKLLKLRELKQVHPERLAFGWPAVSAFWNTTHPADLMTESQFKELYYNAERAGMDLWLLSVGRQISIDRDITLLDINIDLYAGMFDFSELDINDPDDFIFLKCMWPSVQDFHKKTKELRQEKERIHPAT